jgi:hypothetical protein
VEDANLTCIAWNRGIDDPCMFAAGFSDGSVCLWSTPPISTHPIAAAAQANLSSTMPRSAQLGPQWDIRNDPGPSFTSNISESPRSSVVDIPSILRTEKEKHSPFKVTIQEPTRDYHGKAPNIHPS